MILEKMQKLNKLLVNENSLKEREIAEITEEIITEIHFDQDKSFDVNTELIKSFYIGNGHANSYPNTKPLFAREEDLKRVSDKNFYEECKKDAAFYNVIAIFFRYFQFISSHDAKNAKSLFKHAAMIIRKLRAFSCPIYINGTNSTERAKNEKEYRSDRNSFYFNNELERDCYQSLFVFCLRNHILEGHKDLEIEAFKITENQPFYFSDDYHFLIPFYYSIPVRITIFLDDIKEKLGGMSFRLISFLKKQFDTLYNCVTVNANELDVEIDVVFQYYKDFLNSVEQSHVTNSDFRESMGIMKMSSIDTCEQGDGEWSFGSPKEMIEKDIEECDRECELADKVLSKSEREKIVSDYYGISNYRNKLSFLEELFLTDPRFLKFDAVFKDFDVEENDYKNKYKIFCNSYLKVLTAVNAPLATYWGDKEKMREFMNDVINQIYMDKLVEKSIISLNRNLTKKEKRDANIAFLKRSGDNGSLYSKYEKTATLVQLLRLHKSNLKRWRDPRRKCHHCPPILPTPLFYTLKVLKDT